MKTVYKIGVYRDGQQIAREVYSSHKLSDVKIEFKRMHAAAREDAWDDEHSLGQLGSFRQAWRMKHFSEDVNNVAIFKCPEETGCYTNYIYQGMTSNMM